MSLSELGRSRGLERHRARARAPTCGRRRSTRPRRSAIAPGAELFELQRAAHARRAADLARPQPRAAAARCPALTELDFTTRLAVRRARARTATRPRAPTTSSRRAARTARRGGAAGAGAGRAGPVRDDGRDRRGRPGRRPGPHRLPRRPLSIPGDADAPRCTGRGRTAMRSRMAQRGRCRSCWRSPSPACGGTPGAGEADATRPTGAASNGQDERVREPRPRHADASSRPRARGGPRDGDQGADASSSRQKYPNVTVKVSFRDFASWIKQAKLAASSDNPPDVFAGNQGYQLDGELVKAGPDPAARRVREGLRLGQVLHARDAAAVRVDRRRQDVRRGHAVGRRPERPVDRRVRQHGEAARRPASIPRR